MTTEVDYNSDEFLTNSRSQRKQSSLVRPPSLPMSDDDDDGDDAFFDDKTRPIGKRFDTKTADITTSISNTHHSMRNGTTGNAIQSDNTFFDDEPIDKKPYDDHVPRNNSRLNGAKSAALKEDAKSRYSYDDDFSDSSNHGVPQAEKSSIPSSDYGSKENQPDTGFDNGYSDQKLSDNNNDGQDDSYNEDQYSDEFHSDFEPEDRADSCLSPIIDSAPRQKPVLSAKRQPTLSVTDDHHSRPVSSTYDPYNVKEQEVRDDNIKYDSDKLSPLVDSNQRMNSFGSMTRLRNEKGRVSKVSRRTPLVNNSLGARNHTNLSCESIPFILAMSGLNSDNSKPGVV